MLRYKLSRLLCASALTGGLFSPTGLAAQTSTSATQKGFVSAHLLVSTDWVAKHASDDGVTVVDVRPTEEFDAGHIAGAVNIPTSATYDPAARGSLGSTEQIATILGAQGISAATHVVLYDGGKSTAAARVFWSLEVRGHASVSVLDGGFAKWQADGRGTAGDPTAVTPVEYAASASPRGMSTKNLILEDLEDPDVVLLDARSSREFEAGRMPAAVHIEWTRNYSDDEVAVFRSPDYLRALYADQGVTRDKRVHAY
ncbi:MAG: thiosulfate/3-mercaptopyruvate sulfurtransferase [Chlamydiales bacterium]|jgi:thiosulfate/3-mercaptopyruvate sulfurtransferase